MKALILNSGLGHRMGVLTSEHPKCMTELSTSQTILSRQLKFLADAGIHEVVMTTGYFDAVLVNYCNSLELPLHIQFIKNPLYAETNYIYSIYCAREALRDDEHFTYVAVWEYNGPDKEPTLIKEPLVFEAVHLAQRNYKD